MSKSDGDGAPEKGRRWFWRNSGTNSRRRGVLCRERAGQAGNPAPDGLKMARRRTWYKGLGAPVAPGTAKADESGRWLVRGTGTSAALCVRACGWRRRGNEMRERGEMLAGVKSWGELGLGPWRSWAVDGPREACWAMLSLPHSSLSLTEKNK